MFDIPKELKDYRPDELVTRAAKEAVAELQKTILTKLMESLKTDPTAAAVEVYIGLSPSAGLLRLTMKELSSLGYGVQDVTPASYSGHLLKVWGWRHSSDDVITHREGPYR